MSVILWFTIAYTSAMGRDYNAEDEEILTAIALSPDPIVTTSELAGKLPYGQDGVRRRLKELQERGAVKSRKVGARATVWWITTEGREQLG
jgi:predicted ArsR family transcriptional regulator